MSSNCFNIFGIDIIEIIIIGIFIFLIGIFFVPKEFIVLNSMYLQVFTLLIFLVGSIITIINFKYGIDDRKRSIAINSANLTQSKIQEIDKIFMMNPNLDRLYLEMYKDDTNIKNLIKNTAQYPSSPSSPSYQPSYSVLKSEHHASNIIFQTMADVFMCEISNTKNIKDCKEWINTFKGWLNSKILKSHWQYLSREYNDKVVSFINTMINDKNIY